MGKKQGVYQNQILLALFTVSFGSFHNVNVVKVKTSSVQEPCIKCLAVHILEFEMFQIDKKLNQKCPEFT